MEGEGRLTSGAVEQAEVQSLEWLCSYEGWHRHTRHRNTGVGAGATALQVQAGFRFGVPVLAIPMRSEAFGP